MNKNERPSFDKFRIKALECSIVKEEYDALLSADEASCKMIVLKKK